MNDKSKWYLKVGVGTFILAKYLDDASFWMGVEIVGILIGVSAYSLICAFLFRDK
jgi:hypothetical protein